MATLRLWIKDNLSVMGNWHWGDQFDVQNLSDALNVGVLMFCNALQYDGQRCLYNIGSTREDFPYWIALWWDGGTHFRMAQLSYASDATRRALGVHANQYQCFWDNDSLPAELRAQYRECNRLSN